ncbi:hypothetical protein LUZ63_010766 [Rhynchospora breviuscula]|uniref:Bystin n=1 Tax=Rhynchospora breviuscula TaxID=2022672 RepID=A0A9Q0CHS8_9POAL|nr:hypothetical protein LUZ63_010766 [Rhynchospora breviuscula]
MAEAEEKREDTPSEQPQRQQRRVAFALDSDSDFVVSSKKRARSPEHHQSHDETICLDAQPQSELDNTTIKRCKRAKKILSQYTSGKIPLVFKLIRDVKLWEEALYLTEPQNWSDDAMYQVTRVFSSEMGELKLQVFYKNVLLPLVRGNITRNRRLHFPLDQTYWLLKESLSRPAAFNKGFLFPLCQSGTCSSDEAVIIGSIIQIVCIPRVQLSYALYNLAEMDYCSVTSYFINLLLDKSDALSRRAFDALLKHFTSFMEKETIMPEIWHQSLLSFVQRYKNELKRKDKYNLRRLMQNQEHDLITPGIKLELENSHDSIEWEDDAGQPRMTAWLHPMPTMCSTTAAQVGPGLLWGQTRQWA